jgi:hypothetical protein
MDSGSRTQILSFAKEPLLLFRSGLQLLFIFTSWDALQTLGV